jgi:phosphate transport system substrate-binding protein
MRRPLVVVRIAVILGALGLLVGLAVQRPLPGSPGAGPQPRDAAAIPPALTCDGAPKLSLSGSPLASVGVAYLDGAYTLACPGKRTSWAGVGVDVAVRWFASGKSDMIAADRPLTGDELAAVRTRCAVEQLPFVAQPVMVRYRLAVADDLNLDAPTLARIFSGAVTRWDDPAIAALNPGVALPAVPITVVGRGEDSLITAVFQRYLTVAGGWTSGDGETFAGRATRAAEDDEDTLAAIESTDGAIGYLLPPPGSTGSEAAMIGGVAPNIAGLAQTLDKLLPAKGLVFDQEKLFEPGPAEDGAYPLAVIDYAVFCTDDVAAKDYLRSALIARSTASPYLLPTLEWGHRYRDVLQ